MAASDADAGWRRIGRPVGYGVGACFLGQTLLFLADKTGLLGQSPQFHKTSAGAIHDIAAFYAAFLNHQHAIAWDIAVRDVVGPLAYVGLMVLAVAIAALLRVRRPEGSLLVLFVVVGGLLAGGSDLLYLTSLNYFRYGDWTAHPAANTIAVGRSVDAINNLTGYPQDMGFLVLALGLVCLGRLATEGLSRSLALVSYAEAAALAVIAVAAVLQLDFVFNVLALVTGVVLAPAVAVIAGRDVGRFRTAAQPVASVP